MSKYTLKVEVTEEERDLIIDTIEKVIELTDQRLVEAAKYELGQSVLTGRANITRGIHVVRHHFGWKHEYETTES